MSVINRNAAAPIFETLADAVAANMRVGQMCIVKNNTGTDGVAMNYEIKANGSGGIAMNNGNELFGFDFNSVASIADLPPVVIGNRVSVTGYHPGSINGGGPMVGKVGRHDGVIYFDPDRPFPDFSVPAEVAAWYADSGVDADCWTRAGAEHLTPEMAGAITEQDNTLGIDPTPALQAMLDVQIRYSSESSFGGRLLGSAMPVHLSRGNYKISATLTSLNKYLTIIGDDTILEPAPGFSDTYAFSNDGFAFRNHIEGIQFAGFPSLVLLNSNNINSGSITVKECSFFGSTADGLIIDCQSSVTNIEDCVFRGNKHDLTVISGDKVNLNGGWIQRAGDMLTDDYDGAIVNSGALNINGTLFVPQPETLISEPAWIKNSGIVNIDGARFGDEAGGLSIINNFTAGLNGTQEDKYSVLLKNSFVSCGVSGSPAIRLFEIPNIISVTDNRGLKQTGGTLIDWSSSVSAPDRLSKISYARSGAGLGNRFYIESRNVNEVPISSDLIEFSNTPEFSRKYSVDGTESRYELLKTIISVSDVYHKNKFVSYDVSGSASGVRAEDRVESTGSQGGAKYVFATSENAGSLVDRWEIGDVGGFYPSADDQYDIGSVSARPSRIYAKQLWVGSGIPILAGANSPEGQVTAPVGAIYLRTNGFAGATLYVKESGTGNTGWVAK